MLCMDIAFVLLHLCFKLCLLGCQLLVFLCQFQHRIKLLQLAIQLSFLIVQVFYGTCYAAACITQQLVEIVASCFSLHLQAPELSLGCRQLFLILAKDSLRLLFLEANLSDKAFCLGDAHVIICLLSAQMTGSLWCILRKWRKTLWTIFQAEISQDFPRAN